MEIGNRELHRFDNQ